MRDVSSVQDRLLTADALVEKGECFLVDVILYSGTADPGKVFIYDGSSTFADLRLAVSALAKDTRSFHFDPPMKMREGIYADVTLTSGYCLIRWAAAKE